MNLRFTLIDYTINPAGITTQIVEPIDWNKIKIKSIRDIKTHGIVFEVTDIALGYVGDGFTVINTAYQAKGANAETELLVEISCDDNDSYEEFYNGNLVYSLIKFNYEDSCRVEIPCQQIGCLQIFKNRLEQKVDLESLKSFSNFDGADNLTAYDIKREILIPPRPILFIDSAEIGEYTVEALFTVPTNIQNFGILFTESIRKDRESFAPDFNTIDNSVLPTGIPILINDDFGDIECNENDFVITIDNLDIDLLLNTGSNGLDPIEISIQVILSYRDSGGVVKDTEVLYSDSETIAGHGGLPYTYTIPQINTTYIPVGLATGDQFFLYVRLGVANIGSGGGTEFGIDIIYHNGLFKVLQTSNCDTETIRSVFLINETFSRITESITDNCLKVYSTYFGRTDSEPFAVPSDGCGGLEGITDGGFIRNIIQTDGTPHKLFASFKDIYDGMNAIHNIGMGPTTLYGGDVLEIESVSHFYQFVVIHEINDPMEIKIEYDVKRAYSLIKIGYEKWESEINGGLDEFLTNREYRTESKTINSDTVDKKGGTLEQLSKIIASGYAIEVARRQGASTVDFTYDNDLFIICLMRQYGTLAAEVIPFAEIFVQDVLSTTNILNIRISPVRNLIRWFKTIASSWAQQYTGTTLYLIFTKGTGNFIAGVGSIVDNFCTTSVVVENDNITKNRIDPIPNWIPELIKFEAPLSWTEWKLIKANPYQLIKVTKGSATYYGWCDEIAYEPNGGNANFTLLRAFDAENRI